MAVCPCPDGSKVRIWQQVLCGIQNFRGRRTLPQLFCQLPDKLSSCCARAVKHVGQHFLNFDPQMYHRCKKCLLLSCGSWGRICARGHGCNAHVYTNNQPNQSIKRSQSNKLQAVWRNTTMKIRQKIVLRLPRQASIHCGLAALKSPSAAHQAAVDNTLLAMAHRSQPATIKRRLSDQNPRRLRQKTWAEKLCLFGSLGHHLLA